MIAKTYFNKVQADIYPPSDKQNYLLGLYDN